MAMPMADDHEVRVEVDKTKTAEPAVGCSNDPPPSYDSLFKTLSVKRAEGGGLTNYTQGVAQVCKSKVSGTVNAILCGICCTAVGLGIPIAEIVIGSLYFMDCPAERLLPIYLIVGGLFAILCLSCCGTLMTRMDTDKSKEPTGRELAGTCCGSLILVFLFIWFICGSVWVFKMNQCEDDSLTPSTTSVDGCFTTGEVHFHKNFFCKKLLFEFVYYETITKWAILGVIPLVGILFCCCAACAWCCSNSSVD